MGDAELGVAKREQIRQMISANYEAVLEKVGRAASRSGRPADEVRVMAVTKNFPRPYVQAAVASGLGLLGENRVHEAMGKHAAGTRSYELHLVGHLQSNKAKEAAQLFDVVESIDTVHTAVALERRCTILDRTVAILLELNASGEATKDGFSTEAALLAAAAEITSSCPHLPIGGVMTIGAHSHDQSTVRSSFARLHTLHERLLHHHPSASVLSMGMSQDFELAIEEGANLVRIGTALLGPRPAP